EGSRTRPAAARVGAAAGAVVTRWWSLGAITPDRSLREDRGDLLVVRLDARGVAEHRVAHEREPRAVRRVERLLEVAGDGRAALARDLVDRHDARVGRRVLVVDQVGARDDVAVL